MTGSAQFKMIEHSYNILKPIEYAAKGTNVKVILCASEHICSIVRYCFGSFKQLQKDPLHVLTDANILVVIDTYQSSFVNGRFSLPSDIHRPIMYA